MVVNRDLWASLKHLEICEITSSFRAQQHSVTVWKNHLKHCGHMKVEGSWRDIRSEGRWSGVNLICSNPCNVSLSKDILGVPRFVGLRNTGSWGFYSFITTTRSKFERNKDQVTPKMFRGEIIFPHLKYLSKTNLWQSERHYLVSDDTRQGKSPNSSGPCGLKSRRTKSFHLKVKGVMWHTHTPHIIYSKTH